MYFCNMIFRHLLNMRSHPTWVRGLKLLQPMVEVSKKQSHPTWVRGLKLFYCQPFLMPQNVAPYVGAWIETCACSTSPPGGKSHPTWVRGLKLGSKNLLINPKRSHPTWVRGLKQIGFACREVRVWSHPTWVRGLKPKHWQSNGLGRCVAPYVGAWIET